MHQEYVILHLCKPGMTFCQRAHLVPLLLIFVILVVIYWNSFDGVFVFDDVPNIVLNQNVHIQEIDRESVFRTFYGLSDNTINRPVSYFSFALNYFFHGLDPFGYHIVNLSIHIFAAVFVYFFIFYTLNLPVLADKYTGMAGSVALLGAVLWATSPIQVTSVTYIVQRMASMAGMFFIVSLFSYMMGRISLGLFRKILYFSVCFLSGLLSILSKENAVVLPLVIILYEIFLIQGVAWENFRKYMFYCVLPLVIVFILFFVLSSPLSILSGYGGREFSLEERLLTQPRILLYYLFLMIYPVMDRFTLVHEVVLSRSMFFPWTTFFSITVLLVAFIFSLCFSKKYPLFSFCILFFLITHSVESSFIPLELIYEHRNYIPSISIFLMLSVFLNLVLKYVFQKNRKIVGFFVCFLIVFFVYDQGHTVVMRNNLFHNNFYLWTDNAQKSPGLSRVHINLGRVYFDMGMYDEAKKSYYKALEVDRFHRHSSRSTPLGNLAGYYLLIENDPLQAISYYEKARAIRPGHYPYWAGLAMSLIHADGLEWAQKVLEEAIGLWPRQAEFRLLNSFVLFHGNNYEGAIREAKLALALDEFKSRKAYKVLGQAYFELKQFDNAQMFWLRYLRLNPNDLEANLALLYIAKIMNDEILLQSRATKLLYLKKSQSWEEMFMNISLIKTDRVLRLEPIDLVPVIRSGLIKGMYY